ncbi:MAG: hypothetical protein IT308_06470 [Anaerolineaceae bacterium]|nr:hypothetical protein [Anaerolineaceae bacterium]
MYTLFLTLHNITRWLVLIFGVIAVVRAFTGWLGRRSWSKADRQVGALFTGMIDVQLLLGLILFVFYAPFTGVLFSNFGAAMRDGVTRFFALEHSLTMLIVVVLAHIGTAAIKKVKNSAAKYKRAALWFTIALGLILAMIPWPFMQYGRPLLRLFGITV